MILCPTDGPEQAFYLRPANHPTTSCWYSKQPQGHTKLSTTVAWLCASAGIKGHKTNHSLRATTTTRLYHSGVDEQLEMERTGHRSLEGVRSYNRKSDTQREALSDILNHSKQPRVHNVASVSQLPPSNSAAPTYISTTARQKNEVLGGIMPSISITVFVCKITLRLWAKKHKMRLNTAIDMHYIYFLPCIKVHGAVQTQAQHLVFELRTDRHLILTFTVLAV